MNAQALPQYVFVKFRTELDPSSGKLRAAVCLSDRQGWNDVVHPIYAAAFLKGWYRYVKGTNGVWERVVH